MEYVCAKGPTLDWCLNSIDISHDMSSFMIYVPYDFIICDYNLTAAKNTHDNALRKVF